MTLREQGKLASPLHVAGECERLDIIVIERSTLKGLIYFQCGIQRNVQVRLIPLWRTF